MSPYDTLYFALRAATANPLRTALMLLAMSIGVAAVVMLTALGDGARQYVINEFNALGSNLLIVLPGRSETSGVNPANLITDTPRDLSVEDAAGGGGLAGGEGEEPVAGGALDGGDGVVVVGGLVEGGPDGAFGGRGVSHG